MTADPTIPPAALDIDAVLPQVYDDLKLIARRQLRRMRPGATLSTTVLVHETYERLAARTGAGIDSREHLMALCARAMRQILIDHARARSADKRGGGALALSFDAQDVADSSNPESMLALDQVLTAIEREDARLVRLVELRVFAGLEPQEIAELLAVNVRTVQRDWLRARAWIGAALNP